MIHIVVSGSRERPAYSTYLMLINDRREVQNPNYSSQQRSSSAVKDMLSLVEPNAKFVPELCVCSCGCSSCWMVEVDCYPAEMIVNQAEELL